VARRTLGGELHLAAAHVLPAFFQDDDHVIGRAAAGTDEDHLHRARREVATAALGSAIHGDDVLASGLGEERHAFSGPAYGAFHSGFLCLERFMLRNIVAWGKRASVVLHCSMGARIMRNEAVQFATSSSFG